MPLVEQKDAKAFLLNEAGLALKNIGRPKEAEGPLKTAIGIYSEENQIAHTSISYENLADLQVRTGELERALLSAKNALDAAEKAHSDVNICTSKMQLAWILHLLGKTEEAGKEFRQADELTEKITGYRIHSIWGVFYADFFLAFKRIDEAFELTKQNLEICQRNNLTNDISRCPRCLGALERIKGNHEDAEVHLQTALELARKVGQPALEIEALLGFGRVDLDTRKYEDAVDACNAVLKLCERTGFTLYEPEAEVMLGKAYLASGDTEHAETFAHSAYEISISMKYRWPGGDAAHLLGEVYLATGEKDKAREWLDRAVACRKEILDPDVEESEMLLKSCDK